jgi:hypothetical protein
MQPRRVTERSVIFRVLINTPGKIRETFSLQGKTEENIRQNEIAQKEPKTIEFYRILQKPAEPEGLWNDEGNHYPPRSACI